MKGCPVVHPPGWASPPLRHRGRPAPSPRRERLDPPGVGGSMVRLRVIEGERSEAPEPSETPEPRTGFAMLLRGQPYWRRVSSSKLSPPCTSRAGAKNSKRRRRRRLIPTAALPSPERSNRRPRPARTMTATPASTACEAGSLDRRLLDHTRCAETSTERQQARPPPQVDARSQPQGGGRPGGDRPSPCLWSPHIPAPIFQHRGGQNTRITLKTLGGSFRATGVIGGLGRYPW